MIYYLSSSILCIVYILNYCIRIEINSNFLYIYGDGQKALLNEGPDGKCINLPPIKSTIAKRGYRPQY